MTISLIYMEEVLNEKNFKVYLHVTSGPSFPQFIDSKSVSVILFQNILILSMVLMNVYKYLFF